MAAWRSRKDLTTQNDHCREEYRHSEKKCNIDRLQHTLSIRVGDGYGSLHLLSIGSSSCCLAFSLDDAVSRACHHDTARVLAAASEKCQTNTTSGSGPLLGR
jgi:hypothetical protein